MVPFMVSPSTVALVSSAAGFPSRWTLRVKVRTLSSQVKSTSSLVRCGPIQVPVSVPSSLVLISTVIDCFWPSIHQLERPGPDHLAVVGGEAGRSAEECDTENRENTGESLLHAISLLVMVHRFSGFERRSIHCP